MRLAIDVEGNRRAVTDPRGVVTTFDYDMLGNLVRSTSADAGTRRMLANVLGRPAHAWDDRGFARWMAHDQEQRPTELYVDDGTTARLAERTVYGEAQGDTGNHRGRVFQVFDAAGVAAVTAYDFKGNPGSTTRQLLAGYRDPVDWSSAPALEPEVFTTVTTHDARDRPVTVTTSDGTVLRPGYNEAGLLETMAASLRGAATPTTFLAGVAYDEHGRRERADHAVTDAGGAPGSVRCAYGYDPLTFRLTSLVTTRTGDGLRLQDLTYTYDPVGNITTIGDDAQATVFYDNQRVAADADTPTTRCTGWSRRPAGSTTAAAPSTRPSTSRSASPTTTATTGPAGARPTQTTPPPCAATPRPMPTMASATSLPSPTGRSAGARGPAATSTGRRATGCSAPASPATRSAPARRATPTTRTATRSACRTCPRWRSPTFGRTWWIGS
jgi:YD repeat-containing protein